MAKTMPLPLNVSLFLPISSNVIGFFINCLFQIPLCTLIWYTLWLFNIAMENCPFIDDFPARNLHLWGIFHGYVK
jgi:hypothetical protein